MADSSVFINDVGIPDELVPLLVHETWPNVCEFASVKGDGTPVTVPLGAFPGEDRRSIGIGTGLGYPTKAERARKNPKVCLLYSEPKAQPADNPPVILVYGQGTVRDANLQANLERHVQDLKERVAMFKKMPKFMIRWMSGYLARVWIDVTPLRILWWPDADLERHPEAWRAPEGTTAPPSDPAPEPLASPHARMTPAPTDWRTNLADALGRMGRPILTVVDDDGYPVPFRARCGSLDSDGVHLELPSAMPAEAKGRACLTFHTVFMKNGEMSGNDNMTFIGDVAENADGVTFRVERQLPGMSIKGTGLREMLAFMRVVREAGKRAEVEAARRGQPAPRV